GVPSPGLQIPWKEFAKNLRRFFRHLQGRGEPAMAAPLEADFRTRLQDWLPKIVLAPSFAVTLLFVYGFILFTIVLSFTGSKMLPKFDAWVGLANYRRLFALPEWQIALKNIAIFASLYIVICTLIGLMLAIFLDQKIRGEGGL